MARLASALALIAAAAATTFDYAVEVSTLRDGDGFIPADVNQYPSIVLSNDGFIYASTYFGPNYIAPGDNAIFVFTEDGEEVRVITVLGLDYLAGLAVNHIGNRLYYGGGNDAGCVRVVELDNDDVTYNLAGDCDGSDDSRDGFGEMAQIDYVIEGNGLVIDDASMNLYFSDYCDIRRIHIHTAEVTTIAGGLPGDDAFCGVVRDDYHGSDARFYYIMSLAIHSHTLYVYDMDVLRTIDVDYPHSVSTIAGTNDEEFHCSSDASRCGGRGADVSLGGYSQILVDNFGEWLFVSDDENSLIFQCALDGVVECAAIVGEYGEDETLDGVGTNARIDEPFAIAQGKGMSHDSLFVTDNGPGVIRKLKFADLRDTENDSPKFTIGVFVASGVAALLAGFVVLNAAPVA